MPKVIHVLRKFEPDEWGGVETYLTGLLPELSRLGWQSEVHAPLEAGTDGLPFEELGVTFRTFRAHYPYLGMDTQTRRGLVKSGGNLVTFDELWRLMRSKVDLLHVHTQRRLGGVVRVASRLKGVPYAVTLHGPVKAGAAAAASAHHARTRGVLDLGAPFGLVVGARRVVNDADLVFVINREEELAWQPARSGRHLERVGHGVSPAPSTASARESARSAVPGLGAAPFAALVGRLDPNKGQDFAIDAFLEAAPPSWHLVLAGSATDTAYARRLEASASKAGGRVHLIGGVPPARARALLGAAALVLVPSRVEPFGIVLLEAWAEGAPTLYSDVGGLAEISRRVDSAFGRVPQPSMSAWAAAIRRAVANPAALETERREGPQRVAAHYSWATVAERIAAAYDEARLRRR